MKALLGRGDSMEFKIGVRSGPEKLRAVLTEADAVVIGAGAGLSASAGFVYTGERFKQYFSDFARKYGFQEQYGGTVRHLPFDRSVFICQQTEHW